MRRYIKIICLTLALLFVIPPPQAQAFDPVTIAILAPIALQVASAARPYVIRGMINMGKGMLRIGKDLLEFFYLPFGLFKLMVGEIRSGLVYSIRGGIAPGKMIFHVLLLPLYMFGLNAGL